jgi:pilus assembly protein Flp/PilA
VPDAVIRERARAASGVTWLQLRAFVGSARQAVAHELPLDRPVTRQLCRTVTSGTAAYRIVLTRCDSLGEDPMQLVNFVKSFVRNDEGQDLLEYALLVALIALVAVAAVGLAGGQVKAIFNSIAGQLQNAAS